MHLGAGGDLADAGRGQPLLLRAGAVGAAQVRGADADQDRFRTVLYVTLEVVRIAALLVQPVMPDSAAKLLDLLGQAAEQRDFGSVGARIAPGTALPAPSRGLPALPGRLDGVIPRHVAVTVRTRPRCLEVERHRRRTPRPQRRCDDRAQDPSRGRRRRIRRRDRGQPSAACAPTSTSRWSTPARISSNGSGLHQLVAGSDDATVAYAEILGPGIELVVDAATRIDAADRRRVPVRRRAAVLRLSDLRGRQRFGDAHRARRRRIRLSHRRSGAGTAARRRA